MFYRRKILLALLEQFGGKLDKISLQKLLFLFVRQQDKKSFHFIPYRYGCYSFQANADLKTMTKYSQTFETENYWEKIDATDYYPELNTRDKAALRLVMSQYGSLGRDELIELTYKKYPFFAINSTIANKLLTVDDLKIIENQRPVIDGTVLFTIGYEGISLEQYMNKLIVNGVKVLCDVRKNPVSMKFGFNKNQLIKACEGVGIEYKHFPEVGIENDKRQELNTQADYDKLFVYYREKILIKESGKQDEILKLLITRERIALTCFEADIHQCHRKHLADSISKMDGFKYEIRHI
ncbi:MAG: DUF488 domain-containing protein [Bacteroidales bacterium]|nr:DUF488 domain-containing protein [Bacteroidales bacterium]